MKWLLVLLTSALSTNAYSINIEQLVHNKSRVAKLNPKIVMSVVSHESGDPSKGFAPNPYALNIEGRSEYPENRVEAYRMIVQSLIRGNRTVGLGLGQVEWAYHSDKFDSYWDALDPEKNIDVTISYLNQMKVRCKGSVACMVGSYHNMTPSIGHAYLERVAKRCSAMFGRNNCGELYETY
ncbi:TPA: hypothetical protein I7682_17960 [Vibrio vulnificus]|nr:hypothetical protein [Vibrio vulnificus]